MNKFLEYGDYVLNKFQKTNPATCCMCRLRVSSGIRSVAI
jgi:hypothetical protein